MLPGRTHPMMNMTGGGGYLLHALHVYDDPAASSSLAGLRSRLRKGKREKREREKEMETDTGKGKGKTNSGGIAAATESKQFPEASIGDREGTDDVEMAPATANP